jgi:hypothetical protein
MKLITFSPLSCLLGRREVCSSFFAFFFTVTIDSLVMMNFIDRPRLRGVTLQIGYELEGFCVE